MEDELDRMESQQNGKSSKSKEAAKPEKSMTDSVKQDHSLSEMEQSIVANPAWYRDEDGRTGFKPRDYQKQKNLQKETVKAVKNKKSENEVGEGVKSIDEELLEKEERRRLRRERKLKEKSLDSAMEELQAAVATSGGNEPNESAAKPDDKLTAKEQKKKEKEEKAAREKAEKEEKKLAKEQAKLEKKRQKEEEKDAKKKAKEDKKKESVKSDDEPSKSERSKSEYDNTKRAKSESPARSNSEKIEKAAKSDKEKEKQAASEDATRQKQLAREERRRKREAQKQASPGPEIIPGLPLTVPPSAAAAAAVQGSGKPTMVDAYTKTDDLSLYIKQNEEPPKKAVKPPIREDSYRKALQHKAAAESGKSKPPLNRSILERRDSSLSESSRVSHFSHKSVTFNDRIQINEIERQSPVSSEEEYRNYNRNEEEDSSDVDNHGEIHVRHQDITKRRRYIVRNDDEPGRGKSPDDVGLETYGHEESPGDGFQGDNDSDDDFEEQERRILAEMERQAIVDRQNAGPIGYTAQYPQYELEESRSQLSYYPEDYDPDRFLLDSGSDLVTLDMLPEHVKQAIMRQQEIIKRRNEESSEYQHPTTAASSITYNSQYPASLPRSASGYLEFETMNDSYEAALYQPGLYDGQGGQEIEARDEATIQQQQQTKDGTKPDLEVQLSPIPTRNGRNSEGSQRISFKQMAALDHSVYDNMDNRSQPGSAVASPKGSIILSSNGPSAFQPPPPTSATSPEQRQQQQQQQLPDFNPSISGIFPNDGSQILPTPKFRRSSESPTSSQATTSAIPSASRRSAQSSVDRAAFFAGMGENQQPTTTVKLHDEGAQTSPKIVVARDVQTSSKSSNGTPTPSPPR